MTTGGHFGQIGIRKHSGGLFGHVAGKGDGRREELGWAMGRSYGGEEKEKYRKFE